MYNNREYKYTHVATNTTTTPFTGKGILQAITLNTAANGAITVSDGSVGSVIAIIKASAAEGTYWYNVSCASGLNVVTAGATDITITWCQ